MAENRRSFLKTAGSGAAALALGELMAGRAFAAEEGRHEDFIRQVTKARIFDLSHTWDENSPIASVNPPYAMMLNKTHAPFTGLDFPGTRGQFGDGGQLSFTSEVQHFSGQHGAPSIDTIGHIGRDGKLYGGVDAAAATSNPLGVGRSGVGAHLDIAHYPKERLVNRAVLLDVARAVNGNDDALAGSFNITDDHLAETARLQGVRLRRGDTVLIRTGWGRYFSANPGLYKGDNAAGVGVAGAKFLVKSGAAVVGNDTLTFEVRPPLAFPPETPTFQVFPVHMLVIADNGINIIENYFLEEIAAAQEYEFVLVVPPLKIRGGTGSALRSFALVP
ncbi:MAG: cyclase family protein [Betaproteobacteria bacterium]|nr:MAG: cyclase family protein [Betaproteobacteria bacterium]